MAISFQDKPLACRDCSAEFVWTSGEQAFYASKNLINEPSRCPSCRASARAARMSGEALPPRSREFFPAVCGRCGVQTQVPFLPREDRPVFCSSCYDQVRAERVSSGTR